MLRRVARAALLSSLLLVPIAFADPNDDAGSGKDAPNARANAYKLQGFGGYAGRLDEMDVDWFAVEDHRAELTCVRAEVNTTKGALAQLGVDGSERTLAVVAAAGRATPLALATTSVDLVELGLGPAIPPQLSSVYTFDVEATAFVPAQLPDPRATGGPVSPGECVGGDLLALVNGGDAYTVPLEAGELVWWSLAATGPVELRLLAPDGTQVGPTVGPDELGGAIVPATGTYTLSAGVVGLPLGRVDYLAGITDGVEPPTNPCRPSCKFAGTT